MNALLPVLAAVSEPAPAGRSSPIGIAIVLLCLAALAAAGILAAVRGRRGGNGRPGGDAGTPPAP